MLLLELYEDHRSEGVSTLKQLKRRNLKKFKKSQVPHMRALGSL